MSDTTNVPRIAGTCREGYWTSTYGHRCSRGTAPAACPCEDWQQSRSVRPEQLQILAAAHAAELHKPAEPVTATRQPRDMRRVRKAIRARSVTA